MGLDHNSGKGHHLEPGHYLDPGQNSDPGSWLVSNLDFVSSSLLLEPILDAASPVVHSLGFPLVFEGGLELGARASLDSGLGPSSVEFPLLLVQVLGENGSV